MNEAVLPNSFEEHQTLSDRSKIERFFVIIAAGVLFYGED